MRKRFAVPLVLLLLASSYFARPVYDFAWVAAGRLCDMATAAIGAPTLRRQRGAEVGRNLVQGTEIAAYLRALQRAAPDALAVAGAPAAARERLRKSLRYPPPSFDVPSTEAVVEKVIGEDEFASYRELKIPVLPGVYATGVYLRPKTAHAKARLPLVISAHGRGGMPPETADGTLGGIGKSRRDLSWHALKHGYAVWQPVYVHYDEDGSDFRDRLTVRAWQAGTSLPAIEIAKTVRALDALLKRPDIDPDRVAMMGHSYGGFYTLYTTALEPRIRVAVVSAYFNDREAVLNASEPDGFLDWRFPDSLTQWRDPSVAALVAPRPLLINAGNQDQLFPIAGARKAAPEIRHVYERLGVGDRFKFREYVARHDFDGATAMRFIDRHLELAASEDSLED
jgi:dienelactone hydrolase